MDQTGNSRRSLRGKLVGEASKANCCSLNVTLDNNGTVNIYNCPAGIPGQPLPDEPDGGLPPLGACIPLAVGRKPKKSLQSKLRPLLENNKVPSALCAAFFQLARRYLDGQEPANSLESSAFQVLNNLSPELQRVLTCSTRVFESLPAIDRDRLFAPELLGDATKPVNTADLAQSVANELLKRVSLEAFNDTECIVQQRPGLIRQVPGGDDVGDLINIDIYRVNGLRTNRFQPPLSLAEYQPEELQQSCTLEVVDGEVTQNCEGQTEPCEGASVEGICLRIPEVRTGDGVMLSGVNFFHVDARVRLVAQTANITREVDAHVCGDIDTPLKEVVGNEERVITDSRVHDLISFSVPEDLPPATYEVTAIVPNPGVPGFGDEFTSNPLGAQLIRVLPPESAVFQMTSETLIAEKETSPAFFGSDEVALSIGVTPIALDLTPGEIAFHKFPSAEHAILRDVDSGEHRDINRVLFQQGNISGIALAILGFEVDDEDIFQQQIQSFKDAYEEILTSNWKEIAASLGSLASALVLAAGLSQLWATAIAAAVTFAFTAFVALWAPADLVIEDFMGRTALDLAMFTGAAFPAPPTVESKSVSGIDVEIVPIDKGAQEYRERREYRSDEEDSEFHLVLRYNRLA